MFVKLKKGNKVSEVYPLNGLTPRQMMEDHNADEVHLLEKNGVYHSLGGETQKWRTKKVIKAQPPIIKSMNSFSPIDTPGHSSLMQTVPANIEAAHVQIMYLQTQLAEAKADKNRFQDKFEEFKAKFEKTDRELYEVKQDHREELRDIENEKDSGLNGIVEKHPELAKTAMEIFGPLLVNKLSPSSNNQQLKGGESTSSELTELFNYLKEANEVDKDFVTICNMLCHIHSRQNKWVETSQFINEKYS